MMVIVPARGGSKGIPQKNLRAVGGKPLVLRTLDLARAAVPDARIVCSTDDPTIAAIARLHGYEVHDREALFADDQTTVQLASYAIASELGWSGMTMVLQPTAAALTVDTIRECVDLMDLDEQIDSLSTVTAEHHILRDPSGKPMGDFVNRQDRAPWWRETGGVQMARVMPAAGSKAYAPLVGGLHQTVEITADEALDVDTIEDLTVARMIRRRITFVVVASDTLGTGHLRRCLALAQELDHHQIMFSFLGEAPEWAVDEIIAVAGYPVVPDGFETSDLFVFDCLDTTEAMVAGVRALGSRVVCLEDLGPGAGLADFVVNELYDSGHVAGPRYAVLRPEFMALPPFEVRDEVRQILVTFGGTDPARLSDRVAGALDGLAVRIVCPDDVMAERMCESDLLVTSCGRTVHEAAAVGLPTITIAANAREERHSHCPGVIELGLHATVADDQIRRTVEGVARDPRLRAEMSTTMRAAVDGKGARRIAHIIEGLAEGL